jgi:tRNA(fMet)-specific endonuclease VapC
VTLYVLDTDILSLHQAGHPVVSQRVLAHPAPDLAITVITVEERFPDGTPCCAAAAHPTVWLWPIRGWRKPFLAQFAILPFPESAIRRFEQLLTLRLRIGSNDLRIAAITLENSAILVSRNLRDFGRVPGLTVEDWSV